MDSTVQIILGVLGVIGVGGVITSVLNKQKELEFKRLEDKARRYKSCLLFMDARLTPAHIKYLISRHQDIEDQDDVIGYLEAEFNDMVLYASQDVIRDVKKFIEAPNRSSFSSALLSMRKDLWAKKSDLRSDDVLLGPPL